MCFKDQLTAGSHRDYFLPKWRPIIWGLEKFWLQLEEQNQEMFQIFQTLHPWSMNLHNWHVDVFDVLLFMCYITFPALCLTAEGVCVCSWKPRGVHVIMYMNAFAQAPLCKPPAHTPTPQLHKQSHRTLALSAARLQYINQASDEFR